ncbi:MAG: 30S ribosomal protein S6 [Gemmatimonadota bacterium]
MRDYEVVYIFQSALTPEEVEARLDRYHAILTGDGGQVRAVEHWGKRQLAYPIRKETNGYYVVTQFTADPEILPELEHTLKLDEQLLRHLVVLSEGELPFPSSPSSSRVERGAEKAAPGGAPEEGETRPVAEAESPDDEAEKEAAEPPEDAPRIGGDEEGAEAERAETTGGEADDEDEQKES